MERYRKNTVTRLQNLHYLDDRPISEGERLSTLAWAQGGNEAEREEKLRQLKEKEDTYESNFAALRAKQEEARERYSRIKDSKVIFQEAAQVAMSKGLGANVFSQQVFEACVHAIT